jgi:hypothetical protein
MANLNAWSLLWFVGLIFFALPAAHLIAAIYIFLSPISVCVDLASALDVLLTLMRLPITFTENFLSGKSCG